MNIHSQNNKISRLTENINGWFVGIVLIQIFAICLIPSRGTGDVRIFLENYYSSWLPNYFEFGLIGGYLKAGDNYPPLSFVLIALVGEISQLTLINSLIIYKIFLYFFFAASTYLTFRIGNNLAVTAIMSAFLLLNPMGLGYLDITFVVFIIASLFELKKGNLALGLFLYAIACNFKYQPLVIGPFVLIYAWSVYSEINYKYVKFIVNVLLPSVILQIILIIIFGRWVIGSFELVFRAHPMMSANTINFNWILIWILHFIDPEKYQAYTWATVWKSPIPKIIFYLGYIFSLISMLIHGSKKYENLLYFSAMGFLSYCMFNTGVHENHWYLAVPLLGILAGETNKYWGLWIYWGFSATMNLLMFYGISGERISVFNTLGWPTLLWAILNTLVMLACYLSILNKNYIYLIPIFKKNK